MAGVLAATGSDCIRPRFRRPSRLARRSLSAGMHGDEQMKLAHAALGQSTSFEALSRDATEVEAWLDWELSSLIEGRFAEQVEVADLSGDERKRWLARATYRGAGLIAPHDSCVTPYWLLRDRRRVGTLSLSRHTTGWMLAEVSSLYVHPAQRRRGTASRALHAAYAAVTLAGCRGLRVPTPWTWQAAVRFYASRRLWVQGWKHSLVFVMRRDLPDYRVEISGSRARFLLLDGARALPLLECEHLGQRLGYRELDAYQKLRDRCDEPYCLAPGTLALHLALAGWPLIRSDEDWQQRRAWCDFGMPEGLAHKIALFEAIERESGYRVQAPRIPGLPYEDCAG